jgi:DNA-binding MarR family transcriptional regulator
LIEMEGPRDPIEPRAAQVLGVLATAVTDRMVGAMTRFTGLSPTALAALLWIGRLPGIRASVLMEGLSTSQPSTARPLTRLETRKLILRERDRGDARAERLRLSELGARKALMATRARAHAMRQLVEELPLALRPRLVRIAELLVPAVTAGSETAFHGCRFCDMSLCGSDITLPCPVALAAASQHSSSAWIDPELPAIYSDRTVIEGRDPPFELWLEPGAIAFRLDSTRRLEVVCRSPVRGRIELERLPEGHITLYAWNHATFTVLEHGREIFVQESHLSLSMADGDTPRKRVEFVFGAFDKRRAMQPNRWL